MSCIVDPADIPITRGNNFPPVQWLFLASENPDVLFNLAGSVFKLRVYWPAQQINVASDTDPLVLAIDLVTAIVQWNYSVADSRLLPAGRIARYELERWIGGTQQSVIAGFVAVEIGANPD